MGFFSRLKEFASDMGEIANDVRTLAKESKEEFTELMTDGFKEMVIKDNNDYKSSFEKRDQATAIIANAKSKLNRKVTEVNEYADETEAMMKDFYGQKINITKQVLQTAKATLVDFERYDIKSKINSPLFATINSMGKVNFSLPAINSLTSTLAIINTFMSQARRVKAMDDYLEEAKDYRSEVNYEIARLDSVKAKLQYMREVMKEEQNLLERLIPKLQSASEMMKYYMGKKQLTTDDAKRAENLFKIAEMLHKLITTTFINKNLSVSQKYLDELAELKGLI
jgi:hypothetical protein